MRLQTVLVVAIVVLAGCSGFGATPDGTTGDRGTTVTETAQGPTYPAGVTGNGLTNTTALVRADQAARNDTGYVIESWVNATTKRGGQTATVRMHTRERAGTGGEPVSYAFEQRGPRMTNAVYIYGNSTESLSKQVVAAAGNESVTYRRASSVSRQRSTMGGNYLQTFLELGNFTTTNVSGTGESTRITLEATSANQTVANRSQGTIGGYNGTLVVDETGRVRSLDVTTTISSPRGGSIDYSVDYDLRDTGETVSVARPSWYETAQEEAPDVSLNATAEGTAIAITNTGSDTVDAGRDIVVQKNRSTGGVVTLEAPLEPGETLYVYADTNSSQFQQAREPPSEGRALDGTYEIGLPNEDGTQLIATASVTFE